MNLLFVIDSLGSGGAQRQMILLANSLSTRGHSVQLYTYQSPKALASTLLPTVSLVQGRKGMGVEPLLKITSMMRRTDLTLAYLDGPNTYASVAGLICRVLGERKPVVVSERSCDISGKASRRQRVARSLYRCVDAVVVNSYHHTAALKARHPELGQRMVTIRNGVDVRSSTCRTPEPGDTLRILAVGSVSQHKNPLILVEALGQLLQSGLKAQVTWVGQHATDVGRRGEYIREVIARIRRLGLDDAWRWVEHHPDIPALLKEYDCLVHPSFGEGTPNVICEALSAGTPVLASNVLDHGNLLAEGRGLLFDPHSISSLSAALRRFSDMSKEQRFEMGVSGTLFAQTELRFERVADAYEDLFHKLLDVKR